jgi:excinuclease ABC subunit C
VEGADDGDGEPADTPELVQAAEHAEQVESEELAAHEADASDPEQAPGQAWIDYVVAQASASADAGPDVYRVRPERVFVPGIREAINLKPGSSERYLMERVRDEAHRFAITLHRKRRSKRSLKSALDEIEGVGPALKRALVKHFGSVAAIRNAEVAALCEVRGIGQSLAERIRASLGRG